MGGFRKFLSRGALLDLAVAVVVGVAFNAMVQALIKDLITPLIAAAGGQHDFSSLTFEFHNSKFQYGSFINAVVSFLTVAAVVYYLLVAPAARLAQFTERNKEASERACPECLSDIPVAAKRCRFCTAEVEPVTVPQPAPEAGSETLRSRLISRLRNT